MRVDVNLQIDEAATREARELGIDMSGVAEAAIRDANKVERNRRWREQNGEALDAYAREIEREGLALARYRTF